MDRGLVVKKSFFVISSHGDIKDSYDFGKKLGDGSYGNVYLGTHKVTGQVRAIKQIPKSRIRDAERLESEISIMKNSDHPNIVKLYEVFEDARFIYLVMECCSGGELFNYIIEKKQLTEREAAHLFHQLLSSIRYLHSHNIIHRDLKPENLLFGGNPHQGADLKLCDFGLAKIFTTGSEAFRTRAGTPFYIAPEILAGTGYGKTCDIWSCGVILYILLCGYPPFFARTDAGIMERVRLGRFNFDRAEWNGVTEQAKDLIRHLLVLNVDQRYTVEQALAHPWIASNDVLPDQPLNLSVDSLRDFVGGHRLKKAVLMCIASQCSDADLRNLRESFVKIDANGDGTITLEELERGMASIEGINANIAELMRGMDVDRSGSIDYSEFLAATLDKSIYMQEERLYAAFKTFDLDGSGKISARELSEILGKERVDLDGTFWDEIIREADTNHDGEIDFTEFIELMNQRRLSSFRA
ncbi:unnamed protein product [Blepharisma stoltei]|uniref:non-specific serine/threonine protein kinase n=1 Tax=Blepharisma stoltei TaxID=1481888 RepID=A0AAU9KBY0_9CILI|nr:unnamed protein product [Blepharisma stoltei]